MTEVVVLAATRSPIGKRNGALAGCHSTELLADVLASVVSRAGVDAADVDQVIGGCIAQVGMQSFNVTRTAWLTAGLPYQVPAMTMDTQCGSSQHAVATAANAIRAGAADVVVACGVENMSRVPMGSSLGVGVGKFISRQYRAHYEYTSQFEAAERIADKWGITRKEADELGLLSQQRAAVALAEGRFDSQVTPIDAPNVDAEGNRLDGSHLVQRDECPRETSLEKLAALKPVARPDGIHTAGTSSQISDAAGAVVLASRERAEALGLPIRARIVDTVFVGTDPVLNLTGPIEVTRKLLSRGKLGIGDFDVIENNEAFASVVLAWDREFKPDWDHVNPNGGAIALGHALGSTGVVLITKALHELERTDGGMALVTMCCGGGLGTGTVLERV